MSAVLHAALHDRLQAVLERAPVTEAELRKLTEEGRASALLARAELERAEGRLSALADDPESSLADVAVALRQVQELRPALDELDAMLGELHARAREFRRSWVDTARVDARVGR